MQIDDFTIEANEGSTFQWRCTLTDESGAAMTPLTVEWSLTDAASTVVNARADVALTPAPVVGATLTDMDLYILPAYVGTRRWILLHATYDSDAGDGLHLRAQKSFDIVDLVGFRP